MHLLILCWVVKLADTPPCLGGGENGKPVRANYSLKVRLLPLQLLNNRTINLNHLLFKN